MASTNKTTNYELSQYLGSDKPTYLGDYNSDMLKIDNAIHQNALNIATADEKATLQELMHGQALTNASNAQTTADTANTTANSALSKATANETDIANLEKNSIYSENEIEIGKWIDNKPLYRKVIMYRHSGAMGSNGRTININIPHNISDLKYVTKCDCNFFVDNSSVTNVIPNIFSNQTNVTSLSGGTNINQIDATNIVLRVIDDNWDNLRTVCLILEYTKTTD